MKILVVGAGLYGCTIASLLKDSGHQVEIAEQTNDIGAVYVGPEHAKPN